MEVYIHLYHFISSRDPTWNEVIRMNINLHSPLEMKW
jgi:hypothetical protein